MYLLLLGESGDDPRRVDVDGELIIGREPGGFVLDDSEVSRRHAKVHRGADGALVVEDLGSRNGTRVNGEWIRVAQVLAAGDRITIGVTVLEVGADVAAETRLARPAPPADETVVRPSAPPEPPAAPVEPAAARPREAAPTGARRVAAAAAVALPGGAPVTPFGKPVARVRGGAIASRRSTPAVLTFLVIVATAVALVVYFAMH